jgi:hypothetical protein
VATGELVLPEGRVYAEEPSDLALSHANELNDIQRKVELSEIRGTPLSLKELETLATLNHGDNIFLAND